MSILLRKLFSRLHEEQPLEGGSGGGGAPDDAAIQREQELEASRHGWVPKHKFNGPEGKWKDAATFLRDGQNFKSNLQSELARVKQELAEFKGTAKQFAEFQQRQIEARDAEIASLQKDLKTKLREAIRDGDDAAADALEDRIVLLQDERNKAKKQLESTKQQNQQPDTNSLVDENGNTDNPVIQAWIADGNEWFKNSKPMRDYAFAVANEMIAGGETRRGKPFLDALTARMREAFPLQFGEGRQDPTRRGSMAESGSSSSSDGGHTEADLPEEDLKLMKRGIKEGWTTKERFLSNYFSDAPRIHKTARGK